MPSSTNLITGIQSTLSAATSAETTTFPHHPITCQGKLYFEEDGSFGCEHVTVPPDDPRTAAVLKHSLAMMIIELGAHFEGVDELGTPAKIRKAE